MAGFVHILPKIGLKQPSIFFYNVIREILTSRDGTKLVKNWTKTYSLTLKMHSGQMWAK